MKYVARALFWQKMEIIWYKINYTGPNLQEHINTLIHEYLICYYIAKQIREKVALKQANSFWIICISGDELKLHEYV